MSINRVGRACYVLGMLDAKHDAVVIGSGPNGLTAACVLARAGLDVLVVEAASEVGGGTRTAELTLPGFLHDVCSGGHALGCLSPAFLALQLERYGLEWLHPEVSVAHPLSGDRAALLRTSLADTAATLGDDGASYRKMLEALVPHAQAVVADALSPLQRWPRSLGATTRFRMLGLWSARQLAARFRGEEARALLAGCAAHSVLPLDYWLTGGVGLMFLLAGHAKPWAVARGGSASIARALLAAFEASGGRIELNRRVTSLGELPAARAYLFDLVPAQVAQIAAQELPPGYRRRLERFRMGPGVFKLDWALDGPIPWRAPGCAQASTVHVGGTFEEIAASEAAMMRGECSDHPFLIVCQQSHLDGSRAPQGKHTGYAYCHVPSGSGVDRTQAIESQIERFAPGFRDRILARHTLDPAALQAHNASYIGGAIAGGMNDFWQVIARPTLRWNPYSTPHPKIFLCSQSTPPGGGVHGMCGYYAAESVLRRLGVPLASGLPALAIGSSAGVQ
jgi:phytoene dehydrogenase-like protein